MAEWTRFRITFFVGLAKEVLDNIRTGREAEENYVSHALDTLREIRNAAVESNVSEIDELLTENAPLAESFRTLFSAIEPATANIICKQSVLSEKSEAPPTFNKLTATTHQATEETSNTRTVTAHQATEETHTNPKSSSRPAHSTQTTPRIRLISRDTTQPTLKRRLTSPDIGTTSKIIDGPEEPVIRDATGEESAKKRRALNEPDQVEDIDMGDPVPNKRQRTTETPSAETAKAVDILKEKSVTAATARAESSRVRGIGNVNAMSEMEAEAARQAAAGTGDCFGASAATRL